MNPKTMMRHNIQVVTYFIQCKLSLMTSCACVTGYVGRKNAPNKFSGVPHHLDDWASSTAPLLLPAPEMPPAPGQTLGTSSSCWPGG